MPVRNGANGGPRKPVLMLHGRSVPALAGCDLQYKKYSWAEELAKAGFDVFVMEKTVHRMSEQWLKHGKVEGATSGSYDRDEDGVLTPLE